TASPSALLERSRELKREGYHLVFCALPREAGTVGTRLAEEGLGDANVVESQLHGGFIVPGLRLAVVTHTEWHARGQSPARTQRTRRPAALGSLSPGDVVV